MMNRAIQISGLVKLAEYIKAFLHKNEVEFNEEDRTFQSVLNQSEIENSWFIQDNLRYSLRQWANLLTKENIEAWVSSYQTTQSPKKIGLILAGNIPMVGFHDVLSVVLSGNIPLIKLSSKDQKLIPFLMKKWNALSDEKVEFEMVEKLENFDAVIATGSNNTAKYLEYYFKKHKSIIRKNRTSVAVLKGDETADEIQKLAEDIFRYFGLGCRNVTRLFIPKDYPLDMLFENFINFGWVINHNAYANNYDYNKAIYLLNQEPFWDNNFVMLRENEALFSPLSVINFSRYEDLGEVEAFLSENQDDIQCIVAKSELNLNSVNFGEAQNPALDTYADNVDTMQFLQEI